MTELRTLKDLNQAGCGGEYYEKEISDLKKKVFDIIAWCSQWDETVSTEEMINLWNNGIHLLNDYSEYKFDLRDFHKKLFDSQEQENNTGSAVRDSAELSPDNSPQDKTAELNSSEEICENCKQNIKCNKHYKGFTIEEKKSEGEKC